jgi:CMP-N-acetylneuraminic acid synthetase
MKKLNDVVVIIQARLGSQRIPKKMISPFANSTLFEICLNKMLTSDVIQHHQIYASVYEQELIDLALKCHVNIYNRSKKSAFSEGTPMKDIYEWRNALPNKKFCILVNACCPMLKIETIDNFIKYYLESDSTGLFGVIEKKNYFWDGDGKLLTPLTEAVMNTKTVNYTFEAAHCLYASRIDTIQKGIFMGDFNKPKDIELFPICEEECLDIDYHWQFTAYEALYKEKNGIK